MSSSIEAVFVKNIARFTGGRSRATLEWGGGGLYLIKPPGAA